MRCRECDDYSKCVHANDLRKKRRTCPKAKEKRAITNYESLIGMDQEEMADFLYMHGWTPPNCDKDDSTVDYKSCRDCLLDWLRQEARQDAGDGP